jgi:hypothetical protein
MMTAADLALGDALESSTVVGSADDEEGLGDVFARLGGLAEDFGGEAAGCGVEPGSNLSRLNVIFLIVFLALALTSLGKYC